MGQEKKNAIDKSVGEELCDTAEALIKSFLPSLSSSPPKQF